MLFYKGFISQHCVLLIIEKWKEAADTDQSLRTLLANLSKALDCLSHDLLSTK